MLDAQELHRRITKRVGAGRLGQLFGVSEKMVYAWSGRSPQIRGDPPIEKFRKIMKELATLEETELAALTAAYAIKDVAGLMVVRIYKEEI